MAHVEAADRALIQIVDAALAEAARKSGAWLLCRPGCTQCCIAPFPISQLDAHRLRRGLVDLDTADPPRAARVRERARQSVARLLPGFPGDPATGILAADDAAQERFESFANDEPCPALDPDTGACDLYAARPLTCRTFGPPMRNHDGSFGICELCFDGADNQEIARCALEFDPASEVPALEELEQTTGARGETIVAFCLAEGAPRG